VRKRKLLVVMAVTLAGVAIAVLVAWLRPDRVRRENYTRVEKGMTRAQVLTVLGTPGDYRTGPGETVGLTSARTRSETSPVWLADGGEGPTDPRNLWHRDGPLVDDRHQTVWVDDANVIVVFFDDRERVFGKLFSDRRKLPQGPIDQLRWRLGRLWRTWKVSGAIGPSSP
jgi:hypothetical protein